MQLERRFILVLSLITISCLTLTLGLTLKNQLHSTTAQKPLIPSDWNFATLRSLNINQGNSQIKLQEQSGLWWITNENDQMPVREQRVKDLFSTLKTMSLKGSMGSLEKNSDLMLADNQNYQLTLVRNDKTSSHLSFGKINGPEQFITIDASPLIYATSSVAAFYLKQSIDYWIERKLWPNDLTIADIVAIGLERPGVPNIELLKKSDDGADSWIIQNNAHTPIAMPLLSQWTHDMLYLEADSLLPNSEDFSPTPKKRELALWVKTKKDTKKLEFYRGKSGADTWIVVPSYSEKPISKQGKPLYFTISKGELQLGIFW